MCDIGNNFFLYESRKYKFSRVLIKIGKNTKVIYLNHSILPEKDCSSFSLDTVPQTSPETQLGHPNPLHLLCKMVRLEP